MKTKTILTFVTLTIASSLAFGGEKASCNLYVEGNKSTVSVDFSTIAADDNGFKIYNLINKDGFSYSLQKHSEQEDLTLNIGVWSKDRTVISQFLTVGTKPMIWHIINSIQISCSI